MKKIVLIGAKNETDFIAKRIKNPHLFTITVIESIDMVGEYIFDMIDPIV